MAQVRLVSMSGDERRRIARVVAIIAGITWLALFLLWFSNRSLDLTYARWAALLVLAVSWLYSSSKPAK